MPAGNPAASAQVLRPLDGAKAATTCEIWIRTVGSRRQAFARPIQPIGQRARNWHGMQVAHAEKALRTGELTVGEFAGSTAVARASSAEDEHPVAAAFRENAQLLNRDIDALNTSARGAA
ncbi:hypothetical protein [Variovorax sp. LT1R16]|uniref:hypothetical protein n=1 Tax=Variovorax sp. LT1R16 TaxID=3443728 RepID=UPI003F474363